MKLNIYKKPPLNLIIIIGTLLVIIFRIIGKDMGKMSFDSAKYSVMAYKLPCLETSIYPIGYSSFLKILHLIGFDYIIASKVLIIGCYFAVLLFAKKKNFYFKELIVLFSTAAYTSIFPASWTEGLFISV